MMIRSIDKILVFYPRKTVPHSLTLQTMARYKSLIIALTSHLLNISNYLISSCVQCPSFLEQVFPSLMEFSLLNNTAISSRYTTSHQREEKKEEQTIKKPPKNKHPPYCRICVVQQQMKMRCFPLSSGKQTVNKFSKQEIR